MSLKNLKEISLDSKLQDIQYKISPQAMKSWQPMAEDADAGTLSIFGVIGESYDGDGMTIKRVAGILRSMGNKDVVVKINSPGGSFYDGVGIYNLLREHKGKVTVKVLGIAASAASVIAMAGDEILMGEGSRLMIHNAWGVAIGNRHEMREVATFLEPIDNDMAELYAAKSNIKLAEVVQMMDNETHIIAKDAIAQGFATGMMEAAQEPQQASASTKKALASLENALAVAGYSRSERRETLSELFKGKPSAADDDATPSASDLSAINSIKF